MNIKAKMILGYFGMIAGCILGILLLRAITFGRIVNFWMFLGDLLFACAAAYLIYVGRRGVYSAKGQPRPRARFGWGRMLVGTLFLFSSANSHFNLYPVRTVVKPLEASSPTQAMVMNATAIAIAIGCIVLIASGIWKGLRPSASTGACAPTQAKEEA